MTTRQELAQYNNERLYIEGVLLDINPPTRKNKYMTGLVFASVNLPNEGIEIDHVVIAVPNNFAKKHQLECFKKYAFTAKVGTYYKPRRILGVTANSKAYHLEKINEERLKQIEPKKPVKLSLFLKNRIHSRNSHKNEINLNLLKSQILDKVEGEREKHVSKVFATTDSKSISHADIMREIYT